MNPFNALKKPSPLHFTFYLFFFTYPINPSLHFTLLFISTTHFPSLFTFYCLRFPSLVFTFLALILKYAFSSGKSISPLQVADISKWFQNNQLVLNLKKMYIVKFASSKLLTYPLNIAYNNRAFTVTENIKLLGMHLDCILTWKSHIDDLI